MLVTSLLKSNLNLLYLIQSHGKFFYPIFHSPIPMVETFPFIIGAFPPSLLWDISGQEYLAVSVWLWQPKKLPNANNRISWAVNVLPFWIYLLKALSASLLNFSIILVPREQVGSPTSNSSELLIWGVLHSGAAETQLSLGPRRNQSTGNQETRTAPPKGSPNNCYCYHSPFFSLSPHNDVCHTFNMNVIDLAVMTVLHGSSLNYLDL